MYSTRFQTHYPYEERDAGRPVRTTPVYPLLKEEGAVFGASWGYEYPLWFARGGEEPRDELTFRRPNWFGPVPDVIVLRVSYSGELGYELYLPPEHQIPLFLALRGEGAELGLRCAGMRALGSLRAEKGFAGWGRELSPDYDLFQAGLGRFVKLDKDGFIGRDAALRAAEREPDERLVLFEIDADDTDPCADPWGGEPVLREGEYVGYLTSAGYGHCAGRTLALGYVRSEAIASNAAYDVEVLGKPRPARRLDRPPIDPEGLRMRA